MLTVNSLFAWRRVGCSPRGVSVLLLALTSQVAACRSEQERETSKEVARIAYAVQTLRNAANNEKSQPLERLRLEACSTPQGCELQQICVQGYSIQERVLKTTQAVREALQSGKANAVGAAELLQTNEAELARSKQLIDRCVEIEGQLAREYF